MGLSNKAQAAAVGISAGLLGVGTYIATSPAPDTIKVPLATIAYVSGMLRIRNQRSTRRADICSSTCSRIKSIIYFPFLFLSFFQGNSY